MRSMTTREKDEEDEDYIEFSWVCLGLQVISIRMTGTQSEILPKSLCDHLCRFSEFRHVRIGSSRLNKTMIWDAGADSSVYATLCKLGTLKKISSIELRGYQRCLSKENAMLLEKEMQRLSIPTLLS